MQGRPNLDPIEEIFEAKAATILFARGLGLASVAGLLWHLPAPTLLSVLFKVVAVPLALFAIAPLGPAALVYRNILGRGIGLWNWPRLVTTLGITIFAILFAAALFAFLLPRAVLS